MAIYTHTHNIQRGYFATDSDYFCARQRPLQTTNCCEHARARARVRHERMSVVRRTGQRVHACKKRVGVLATHNTQNASRTRRERVAVKSPGPHVESIHVLHITYSMGGRVCVCVCLWHKTERRLRVVNVVQTTTRDATPRRINYTPRAVSLARWLALWVRTMGGSWGPCGHGRVFFVHVHVCVCVFACVYVSLMDVKTSAVCEC